MRDLDDLVEGIQVNKSEMLGTFSFVQTSGQ